MFLVYQMSLWRPPSDLQSLLKEGCRYKVYNLTTSDAKKNGGSTTVQLTGTKKTQFEEIQVRVRNKLFWEHNSCGIEAAVFDDGNNVKYFFRLLRNGFQHDFNRGSRLFLWIFKTKNSSRCVERLI